MKVPGICHKKPWKNLEFRTKNLEKPWNLLFGKKWEPCFKLYDPSCFFLEVDHQICFPLFMWVGMIWLSKKYPWHIFSTFIFNDYFIPLVIYIQQFNLSQCLSCVNIFLNPPPLPTKHSGILIIWHDNLCILV